ncbi:MAG: class I SAM-dependent methyltransferase [Vicinamibacterales bacterium]
MTSGVATYYDRLGRWNRWARAIGYGGGSSHLTVHRALADPSAGGQPTVTRLHDLVRARLPDGRDLRVLDAGCGLGGTMLALARTGRVSCLGITLSPAQAATANEAAGRAGLSGAVRAEVRSYDEPPAGPFNVIVAIESLAHSPDPARSVGALLATVAPGGGLLVVDDMPLPSAGGRLDLEHFRRGWQCPVLWTRRDYLEAFEAAGFHLVEDVDLTPECRPRPGWRIQLLMGLNRLVRWLPIPALRQVMDSHFGGLALERLTRGGHVQYRLLFARRPELTVS